MAYVNKQVGQSVLIIRDETKELWKIDGKLCLITQCCECKNDIVRKSNRKLFAENKNYYCSRDCLNQSQRNGTAKRKKELHFMETYGVSNPGAIPEIKERKKKTLQQKYGVENCSQIPSVKQNKSNKMKFLCNETDFLERRLKTVIEKYGCDYLATPKARGELRDWSLENYGTDHPMKSSVFKEEWRQSFFDKHGVDNPLQVENTKQQVRKTCLELYGVDNIFKRPDVIKNRLNKMIENSKRMSSKGEDDICETLKIEFNDVERHPIIFYRKGTNSFWIIDAYVPSLDVYIEYDGIYWHGVGKDTEELKALSENGNKVAKMQLSAHRKKKFQDSWFRKNNKKLFRINEGVPNDVWLKELDLYLRT